MSQRKIFVSARWQQRETAGIVYDHFEEAGFMPTLRWETNDLKPQDAIQAELQAVDEADLYVICVSDGGRGSYAEMGVALLNDIPVIALAVDESSLLEDDGRVHPLFLHKNVRVFHSLSQAVDYAKRYKVFRKVDLNATSKGFIWPGGHGIDDSRGDDYDDSCPGSVSEL